LFVPKEGTDHMISFLSVEPFECVSERVGLKVVKSLLHKTSRSSAIIRTVVWLTFSLKAANCSGGHAVSRHLPGIVLL